MYDVSTVGYLRRAAARLSEPSKAALFYAAFELRCGIERRSQEYLEPHDHVPKGRKNDYKIARLGKNLDLVSLPDDRAVRFEIVSHDGDSQAVLYYSPVTRQLRAQAERLGDYLHAQNYRPDASEEWQQFRSFLVATYQGLVRAAAGNLLGAPLVDKSTGQSKLHIVGVSGRPLMELKGQNMLLHVEYLDVIPDDEVQRFLVEEALVWEPAQGTEAEDPEGVAS